MSAPNLTTFKPAPFRYPYTMEPSDCLNQYCTNKGTDPATGDQIGLTPGYCGSLSYMEKDRAQTGGTPTGRGVTPCPFGYLCKCSDKTNKCTLYPYSGINFQELSPSSIFFSVDLEKPCGVPSVGQPRPLHRIGHIWRTGGNC